MNDDLPVIRQLAMKIASRMHDLELPSYCDKTFFVEAQLRPLFDQITRQAQRIVEIEEERADLREAVAELLASEGSAGTFDAAVLRMAIDRLKEIMEGE